MKSYRQRHLEHRRGPLPACPGRLQGQLRRGGPRVCHHAVGPDHHEVGDRQDHPRHAFPGERQPQHCHRYRHQPGEDPTS